MQYQKSLHPEFNPQATIGPLSFGGPVEGFEFTLQKNKDRLNMGINSGGRGAGQGTITSSVEMSLHSFNPNAHSNMTGHHHNSMTSTHPSNQINQQVSGHIPNTHHPQRKQKSLQSKFTKTNGQKLLNNEDDEIVESAGSAFSRDASSVGVILQDGQDGVRKDSFVSQDLISQEKSSSNMNTQIIDQDGHLHHQSKPSQNQHPQQQFLSIFVSNPVEKDTDENNRVSFGVKHQQSDFKQQQTANFMQDSFIKQPSYREGHGGMSNQSRNDSKHLNSNGLKTSQEFENRNFGAFLNDFLLSKRHSQIEEDEYASPVLGHKDSTNKAPITSDQNEDLSPSSQKKRANNLLMSLAQMPFTAQDLKKSPEQLKQFQIQIENCSPDKVLNLQSSTQRDNIPSQTTTTTVLLPDRRPSGQKSTLLNQFESLEEQMEIQNILEQLMPLNHISTPTPSTLTAQGNFSPSQKEIMLRDNIRSKMLLQNKKVSLRTIDNQFSSTEHDSLSPMIGDIKQASEKLIPIIKDKDMSNIGLSEALQLIRKNTQTLNTAVQVSNLGPQIYDVESYASIPKIEQPQQSLPVQIQFENKKFSMIVSQDSTLNKHLSVPAGLSNGLNVKQELYQRKSKQPTMVLRPLKRLTSKLNNDYDQLQAILDERKEDRIQQQMDQLKSIVKQTQPSLNTKQSEDDLIDENFLIQMQQHQTSNNNLVRGSMKEQRVSYHPAPQTSMSGKNINFRISNFSELTNHRGETRPYNSSQKNFNNQNTSQDSSLKLNTSSRNNQYESIGGLAMGLGSGTGGNGIRQSPIILRKISDLSPLAETIEVSEDILAAGGTLITDNISDNSFTRSELRNVSQYMKSDISLSHSVIEVEYENITTTPTPLDDQASNRPILDTFQENQDQAQTTRVLKSKRQLFRPKPVFTQIKSQENNSIGGVDSALLKMNQKQNSASKQINSVGNNNIQMSQQQQQEETAKKSSAQNNEETISNRSFMQREVNISQSVLKMKENGKKKINQYILMKNLGQGSFGKVKLVLDTNNNNQPCAMKVLSKRKLNKIFVGKHRTAMHDVQQEIAIMKKLDHINVVKLFEVLDDPSVDKLYIVMEFVKNGSLMSKLSKSKTIQPQHLWKYFRDLLTGLHYLHECAGIIHRDLKPENILIDEVDRAKISDFGVSFIVENGCDEIQSTAGSNYFFSPEICLGDTYKGKKSDIWAIGVTLYFMMFKRYPFNASNIPILYNKINNQEPDYPADANLLLVDLLKKIFIKDPNKRISLQEIIQHDWVTSNGIQPLQIHLYPQITLNPQEATLAIQRVCLIAKIRLKIKAKVQEQKKKRATMGLTQSINN